VRHFCLQRPKTSGRRSGPVRKTSRGTSIQAKLTSTPPTLTEMGLEGALAVISALKNAGSNSPSYSKNTSEFHPGQFVLDNMDAARLGSIDMQPVVSTFLDAFALAIDHRDYSTNREKTFSDVLKKISAVAKPIGRFSVRDIALIQGHRNGERREVRECEAHFMRTQNPFWAWNALNLANIARLEVPRWIVNYLGCAASRICQTKDRIKRRQFMQREAESVGRALGFGKKGRGQGAQIMRMERLKREWRIFIEVHAVLRSENTNWDGAYDAVGEKLGCSKSTVQRAYDNFVSCNKSAAARVELRTEALLPRKLFRRAQHNAP
jgi:hypothetical protein